MSKIKRIQATKKWTSPLATIPGTFRPVRRPRGDKAITVEAEAADYLIGINWATEVGVSSQPVAEADPPLDTTVEPIEEPAPQVTEVIEESAPEVAEDSELESLLVEFFRTSDLEAIKEINGIGNKTAQELVDRGSDLSWEQLTQILSERQLAAASTHLLG